MREEEGVFRSAFRLDREPWIPVLYTDGTVGEVSLAGLFNEAPRIRDISGDIAQQKLPLLRLALAILYSAFGDSSLTDEEMDEFWFETWRCGAFDTDSIARYLDYVGDGFDLFDDERPFFQVAGLEYVNGGCDGVDELIADAPKPDKYLFAMRARTALDSLSFAEAARWLVFLQAYGTAGIKTPVVGNTHVNKGKVYPPKDSVGTGWLGAVGGVFLQGRNLFETLMLNWVLHDSAHTGDCRLFGNEDDLPAWEREPGDNPADIVEAYRTPGFGIGPAALMTWQSRRVRLVLDDSGTRVAGVVSCYGDILRPANMQYAETMTAWRESKQQQKKLGTAAVPWMPVRHDPNRALWRGLASLLVYDREAGSGNDLRPGVVRWLVHLQEAFEGLDVPPLVAVHAQGMSYGTQSSVFEDGVDDYFDIASAMLRGDSSALGRAVEVVAKTDSAVFELARFVRGVEEAAGDKRSGSSSSTCLDDVKASAYTELDDLFRNRLAAFLPDVDELSYCKDWTDEVHRRLLAMGEGYVADSGARLFGVREKEAGSELLRFRRELNKILGPLSRGTAEKGA